MTMDYDNYGRHYSPDGLKHKLARVARKAGMKVVYGVLLLYYVAIDPKVSFRAKAKIYGVLGYFILPFDLVPDALAGLGYADDLTAIAWALHTVWSSITPAHRERARERLSRWFGREALATSAHLDNAFAPGK